MINFYCIIVLVMPYKAKPVGKYKVKNSICKTVQVQYNIIILHLYCPTI